MLSRYLFGICPNSPDCQSQQPLITLDDTVEEISNSIDSWKNIYKPCPYSEEASKFYEVIPPHLSKLLQENPVLHCCINRYIQIQRYKKKFPSKPFKKYMFAEKNSMPDIPEEDNPCLPLDFNILLPDFIKASSVSRSTTSEEGLSHSIPQDLIYAGQRHHPFYTVVNQLGINQEKVPVVEGENQEDRDGNRLNGNLIENVSRPIGFELFSKKPRVLELKQHPMYSTSAFNNKKIANSGVSADGHSQLPSLNLGDKQKQLQTEEINEEVCHTTKNSHSSNEGSTTNSTAFKMTYAASVQQSASDVQYRRWLASDFPCLMSHSHSANSGADKIAEENREGSTRCVWNEICNSVIFHPNVSTAVKPERPSPQKVPTKSVNSPSVLKTGEEGSASNPFPHASNLRSSGDSYENSIQEKNVEELLGTMQKSLNFSKSSGFEKVISVRNRNKSVSEMHQRVDDPKNWNEEYKKRLLECDIELPYTPKKKMPFLRAKLEIL